MDPALQGADMRHGATDELAQSGRLPVFLSQAVSVAWVSTSCSSACVLYLGLYVGSLEGTQKSRPLKGTKSEVSRNSSGNSGLEQINIVSTAFYHKMSSA